MSRNVVKRAARDVADQIITAARNSGDDPIAWVTGNAMFPPLRSFTLADMVWHLNAPHDYQPWESFVWRVEKHLQDANVYLECPEYDNALYAVDLERFEYAESETGDSLCDDWKEKES